MKWVCARLIAAPAIIMPYRMRMRYISMLSSVMHAPFKVFGRLARRLLKELDITVEPEPAESMRAEHMRGTPQAGTLPRGEKAVVLFSGGTDSTCAAALVARSFGEVHLLTFEEYATRHSPVPTENANRLIRHFPRVRFVQKILSVDALVRYLSYERYAHNLRRHGFLTLATCGFSSLSWHARTIAYCLENDVHCVADGLTRELMHFPGHMDLIIREFKKLYAAYGIDYIQPVRDWSTPPDQQFMDKVLVNRHGGEFFLGDTLIGARKTTGRYLYDIGLLPMPNVKGSRLDFLMQHDCYPFALYNIIAFWGYLSVRSEAEFALGVHGIMREKVALVRELIQEYRDNRDTSRLRSMLTHP